MRVAYHIQTQYKTAHTVVLMTRASPACIYMSMLRLLLQSGVELV
jgi:hypothetical protein